MTLDKDVPRPEGVGFDAVICLGNSFAHLPDRTGEWYGLGACFLDRTLSFLALEGDVGRRLVTEPLPSLEPR